MAKLSLVAGTISKTVQIFVLDASVTTGAGLTGLAFNTGSLTAYYYREGAASAVAITLATMTLGTWGSGGFIVIDGTNMPGAYQLGLPNAALAAGAKSVIVMLKGASNMAPVVLEIELTAIDNQDAVRGGMTALPNAAAGANTGLPVVGTQVPNATAGAAGGVFIAGSNAATTANFTGNITGNLSGSVGSVSGAVGGNITGNLLGTLSTTERDAISDALLDRNMATGTDSGSPTVRTVRQALRAIRNKISIAAATLTVCKEDDSTESWTAAVTTDAAADPVTSVDPA